MYSNLGHFLKNLESIIYVAELDNGFWFSECDGASLESLTGFNQEDFLCRNINLFDLVHDLDKTVVSSILNNLKQLPCEVSHQYRLVRKDRSVVWVQDTKMIVVKGKKIIAKGIIVNINEQKKIENENNDLYSTLITRNTELQEAISSISNLNTMMKANFKLFEETVLLKISRNLIPKIRELQNAQNKSLVDDIVTSLSDIFQMNDEESYLDALSKRETEIAISVKMGLTHKEIADDFNISIDTVKTHVKNIKRKLNISKEESLYSRLTLK
ncbi:MAG: hypothetical protein COW01_02650 [Bdellovibrionales bacterium CG12_big_fil_rev_8_21_14_0_65_38_15]|nr:MAG: hypothetical protein COW79_08315 [Bdellovibrionales bacterium CG22_combo_CG10-13_8_21_14_all_38_13]PIQ56992.1 MAG: hypothetical protein COW01_02650 [Bdellovibrionales bacterium CG12_big_fil_rev_8_21_14_0_65_38_15]PIR29047.1 MAG: hypothetical protein COV38_12470 [Bdellovibrionales bacterium CG11_big_fil_rev_8_21_14_0_20_38_13]